MAAFYIQCRRNLGIVNDQLNFVWNIALLASVLSVVNQRERI